MLEIDKGGGPMSVAQMRRLGIVHQEKAKGLWEDSEAHQVTSEAQRAQLKIASSTQEVCSALWMVGAAIVERLDAGIYSYPQDE